METLIPESDHPLYHQIFLILRNKINSGKWQPRDKLPAEPELMAQFQVSRNTVRLALDKLVDDGLIYRQRGRGTFVAVPIIEQNLSHITSFKESLDQQGVQSVTRLLSIEFIPASDQTAIDLAVEIGEPLAVITHLRLADGEPISLEVSCLVDRYCPGIIEHNLAQNSLSEVLKRSYGIRLDRGKQVVQATAASPTLATKLKVSRGSPLLYVERVYYSQQDIPVELQKVHYRSDRYALRSELRR